MSRMERLLLSCILLKAAGCWAQEVPDLQQAPQPPVYSTNRVIVKLKPDIVRAMAADSQGLKFEAVAGALGAQVFKITDGSSVEDKIKQLEAHPAVEAVEPDYKVHVFAPGVQPNDPMYSKQWHLPKIQAAQAWQFGTGSTDVKVCHVDSGVRVDHPDLVANVVKGWNFVPAGQVEGAPPPSTTDPVYKNYNDTYGHGTHTAGLVGALGNNLRGVAGVNWNVQLYVCRFIWDDGSGFISDAMKCISLCAQEGAMITTNSWGGIGYSDFLKQEIQNSQKRGQLFVVASGNSGLDLDANPLYPASYGLPNMISVASVGPNDDVSSFSNAGGQSVDIAAPGEAIFSTTYNGDYGLMWGTSMATPIVAGAAALIQAQAQAQGVTLTYQQLMDFILNNVDKVSKLQGQVKTNGRLNAFKAATAVDAYLKTLNIRRNASSTISPASPKLPPSPPIYRPSPVIPIALNGTLSLQSLAAKLVCGTSMVRGKSAKQSSTATGSGTCGLGSTASGAYLAAAAIDGRCQGQWTVPVKGSCAMTAKQDYPWWQVDMASTQRIMAVAITTRSDCSWGDLGGAQIWVGPRAFKGPQDVLGISSFTQCTAVPANGVPRGQRQVLNCSPPTGLSGRYLAVLLPKRAARLTLCEVDVINQDWLLKAAQASVGRR